MRLTKRTYAPPPGIAWMLGLAAALGAVLLAQAGMAVAQETPFATPTAEETASLFGSDFGDPFTSMFLNQIFGPLFQPAFGESHPTVFSSIIGYFNIIMLVVGGLMFFYNVTVGILQSAHEGQVLGSRWSSLWAPLRVIFAVGLLVPVPNLGGYNLSQAGVAYLVKGATNIASLVWTTSAEMIIDGKIALAAAPARIDQATVKTMFDNAVCAAVANYRFAAAAGPNETPLRVEFGPYDDRGFLERAGLRDDQHRVTMMSQVVGGSDPRYGICGSYASPELPEYIWKVIEAGDTDEVTLAQASSIDALISAFQAAHVDSMETLYSGIYSAVGSQAVMTQIADSSAPLPDFSEGIITAMNSSSAVLSSGMQEVMRIAAGGSTTSGSGSSVRVELTGQGVRDAMRQRIQGTCSGAGANSGSAEAKPTTCYGEGWIGAGSWYMMMARMNNELSSLTEARSVADASSYLPSIGEGGRQIYILSQGEAAGGWGSWGGDKEAALFSSRYQQAFANSTNGLAVMGFSLSTDQLEKLNDTTSPDSFLSYVPGFTWDMFSLVTFWMENTSPSNWGNDPMIGLTAIGKTMISVSGILFGVGVAAGASVTILGTGVTIPAGIATMLVIPTMAMMSAGVTLTFVLPLTPFIFWVMAVSGYFLLIIEAVVAVNLWALAHMRMDGEGISGEAGRQGWLMLLSLLMTPVLMVLGFLVGMILFRVTTALMDVGVNQALAGILGGGPMITFAALVVYTVTAAVVYMMMIERSFSLVAEFPARVLKWMGANAELDVDMKTARMGAAAGAGAGAAIGSGGAKASILSGMKMRGLIDKRRTNVGDSNPNTPA
ncbi:DotA/TraY family protein [Defluviimonas salinarum]|uniref:DotA/TraY family protein n=1 Tax=Defluviimonas salinarum TaxID=2992147 RepID=A0ABT3J4H3_9RHOB|nr:DotA/TraY family protein [Defluviimonas salinarum]MCW3782578.1 DotA/TraY family protein [Defluviimonas salinarum]